MSPEPAPCPPPRRPARTGALVLLALLLGALGAELYLRLLLPPELLFDTWFTPGIQQYDPKFNVVYTPHWRGLMRHADRVQGGVPLELDAHGFRLPITAGTPTAEAPALRVVLLGGSSAMMSYGLPDDETIAAALARGLHRRLGRAVTVQSTAWAGDNLHRNWNLFREHLGEGAPYDAAVVCHVRPNPELFRDPQGYDHEIAWGGPADHFRFLPGILLWPDEPIASVGAPAYRSTLGYGLLRLAGTARTAWNEQVRGAESTHERALRLQSTPFTPAQMQDYLGFLDHVRGWFASRGTPVTFCFIPRRHFPRAHHQAFVDALPPDWDRLDLQQALFAEVQRPDHFLAQHHYAAPMAEAMGEALAEHLAATLAPHPAPAP